MDLHQVLKAQRVVEGRRLLKKLSMIYRIKRDAYFAGVDEEEFKDELKRVKEFSIQHLPELKDQAIKRLSERRIEVHEVKTRAQLFKVIARLIPKGICVVKTKSNVMSELGLTAWLKKRNEVVETDCGDFIVELCGEEPSHPILPAFHIPLHRIATAIRKKFKQRVTPTRQAVLEWIKGYVRKRIVSAQVGLTGANAVSADGAICIVENEGNVSLVSKIPPTHVVVTGIDKIVPTLRDAMLVCEAMAVWGTGDLPSYVEVITSPSKTADLEGEVVYGAQASKEVHLILVDNGRTRMIQKAKDLLHCINCGACLYACPVYAQILNHYGYAYLGGRGVGMSIFQESIKQGFDVGLYFCTTCQACKVNCPLELDIPDLMRRLREMSAKRRVETQSNKEMIQRIRRWGNPFGKIKEGEVPSKLFCC